MHDDIGEVFLEQEVHMAMEEITGKEKDFS